MIDVGIVVAALAGGALVVKLLSKDAARDDKIWTDAARRVDGKVELQPARFLRRAERRIRLTVERVPMVVYTGQEATPISTHAYYTRVLAGPLPASGASRVECSRRDLVRKLSKRLGLGELPTGDEAFDDAVHVKGSPKAVVLAYLDRATRNLVAESDGGFVLENAHLVVQREGLPSEPAPLIEMTRFAERLVRRWAALVGGPVRLAESLGLLVDGTADLGEGAEPVASGIHRSRPTRLLVRVHGELALTIVSFDDPGVAGWTMERGQDGAFTTSGEAPDAVSVFASTAPVSLVGMRHVVGAIELAFAGLAPDRDDVAVSLDAVIDATAPMAPYR